MTAGRVDPAAGDWRGPRRPYDLVKEFIVALVAVSLLTVVLALLFSSPNEKGVTLEQWAQKAPNDFIATTVSELAGTSTSAGYGPPYNHSSTGQQIGPLHLQKWAGVRIPVDPARDFVISPLRTMTADAAVRAAVRRYEAAPAAQQDQWASAYADALSKAPEGDPAQVAAGDYGPVPAMASGLLGLAQSGALDSQLVNAGTGFYQADYTKPLLFLADGGYLADLAQAQHLSGNQWGMMNETGNFPGQPWLWLYTFWYQVQPFSTSTNADALVWGLMMLLSLALVLVPFIPGVRSIPRRLPLYRLVWRSYYREHGAPRR